MCFIYLACKVLSRDAGIMSTPGKPNSENSGYTYCVYIYYNFILQKEIVSTWVPLRPHEGIISFCFLKWWRGVFIYIYIYITISYCKKKLCLHGSPGDPNYFILQNEIEEKCVYTHIYIYIYIYEAQVACNVLSRDARIMSTPGKPKSENAAR